MARPPKLRKKKIGNLTYWCTKTGGQLVYFGNVASVSFEDAQIQFRDHLKSLSSGTSHRNNPSSLELMEHFLDWIKAHRSERTYDQRRRDCEKFANFKIGDRKIAQIPALKIRGNDFEAWLSHCREKEKLRPQTLLHRQTSIKHCWNWGAKHPSPNSHLPATFRPFSAIERIHVPKKLLTEDSLITNKEIQTLFTAAEFDLDTFHRFGPKEARERNPYAKFADMLRCYYHTGARTSELAKVKVKDVLFKNKQLVLGSHKTSKTQRIPTIRQLTLNDIAFHLIQKHIQGKISEEKIFTNSDGKPWNKNTLSIRFNRVKEITDTQGVGVIREHITIYSFRHLWISDALMTGTDIATIARMAGTSIAMIEKVYGHFRNDHLQEAQARIDQLREI